MDSAPADVGQKSLDAQAVISRLRDARKSIGLCTCESLLCLRSGIKNWLNALQAGRVVFCAGNASAGRTGQLVISCSFRLTTHPSLVNACRRSCDGSFWHLQADSPEKSSTPFKGEVSGREGCYRRLCQGPQGADLPDSCRGSLKGSVGDPDILTYSFFTGLWLIMSYSPTVANGFVPLRLQATQTSFFPMMIWRSIPSEWLSYLDAYESRSREGPFPPFLLHSERKLYNLLAAPNLHLCMLAGKKMQELTRHPSCSKGPMIMGSRGTHRHSP